MGILSIQCISTLYTCPLFHFAVFLPPLVSDDEIRILEGSGTSFLVCTNPNSPEVSSGVEWFGPGDTAPISTFHFLPFSNPLRADAGKYECRVVSSLTGETASATAELIVECKLCCCYHAVTNVRVLSG